ESQVHSGDEVGIKIALEVSNIVAEFTDKQGGRSYQIGTRNANTNLRLKDGETQILGGLITDQDRNTASKIPGLGHLPVVGRIFGNNDGAEVRSEILLAITPRIVRNLAAQTPETRNIFSGTHNVVREKPILAEPIVQTRSSTASGAIQPSVPVMSNNSIGATAPAGVSGNTAPQGQVLFNPQPASATAPAPAPLVESGSLLPTPPTMLVRPPPTRP
ncbi:MAG: type IV pilus secretin PilQ, partial [Ramlibacter sp.]